MRKLFVGAVMALSALFVLPVSAIEPQLGTHYTELRNPQPVAEPGKIEVVEVFWYGCPACNAFEGPLKAWKAQLPSDVSFVRIPVQARDVRGTHARLYYTLDVLRADPSVHEAVFAGIHQQRDPRLMPARGGEVTPEQLASFVSEHGVDSEAFLKTYNSFPVNSRMNRGDQLVRAYQVMGVPDLIVNGKYRVELKGVSSFEELLEVADALIAKERAAQ